MASEDKKTLSIRESMSVRSWSMISKSGISWLRAFLPAFLRHPWTNLVMVLYVSRVFTLMCVAVDPRSVLRASSNMAQALLLGTFNVRHSGRQISDSVLA